MKIMKKALAKLKRAESLRKRRQRRQKPPELRRSSVRIQAMDTPQQQEQEQEQEQPPTGGAAGNPASPSRKDSNPKEAARKRKEVAGGHLEQRLRCKIRQQQQRRGKGSEQEGEHRDKVEPGEWLTAATFNMNRGVSGSQVEMAMETGIEALIVPEAREDGDRLKMTWGEDRVVSSDTPPEEDSGSGVAIFLSERLAKAKRDTSEGQGLGSRLVWVSFDIAREKGTMLVLVGAYRPYEGHPLDPKGEQFDADARELQESFPENWRVIWLGDLNAQLGRSIEGVTGPFTVRPEGSSKGPHGKALECQ
jgi:hypothetical protein